MDIISEGTVDYSVENGVGTITFGHPAHNSLPGKLLADLALTIRNAGEDDRSIVLVLKSEGDRTFCAGASFDELISISNEKEGKKFFMGFANVINACRQSPKLIIGRVQGKAVGGGVGVASAVDYCIASKYASVKLSELAIGIGPFVVGPAVERKIGTSAFSQLSIEATEWYSAEWAEQKGLYHAVLETNEELDQYVHKLSSTLKEMSPEAMKELKRVIWRGTENWNELLQQRAEMSGRLVLSDFTRKAIENFKSKS